MESTLMNRIVFGCGRLTGGASEREALALVHQCLDAGLHIFDTAPSYGMGTAEGVVGKALKGREDCVIVTKLGSAPQSHIWLRTLARAAKRRLRPAPPRGGEGFVPQRDAAQATGTAWDEQRLRHWFNRSRRMLGRIDRLYLHDPAPQAVNADLIARAEAMAREVGAAPGYARAAVWSSADDALFPQGWRAQAAMDPDWLSGRVAAPARANLTLHSLVMTGDWLARQDAAFAAALDGAARVAGNRVAALVALAAHRVPQAELVIASANPQRLGETLAALGRLDAARRAEIIACF